MKNIVFFCIIGIISGSFSVCAEQTFSAFWEADKAGQAALKAKNFQSMRKIYAQAKKIAENDKQKWDAVFYEVRACREMKQFDEAVKLLDEFLAGNPPEKNKAAAVFVKGLVFNSKGDTAKGAVLLEESLNCKTLYNYMRDQACSILMNYYYQKKNFDKCIERAEKVIADKNMNPPVVESARFYIAQCKYDMKKFDECEKIVKETAALIKTDAVKSRMAYLQALLHRDRNEIEEAKKFYELTIKYEPNSWRSAAAKKYINANK